MKNLSSNYTIDSLSEIQRQDGLYGVMLSALRNLEEQYPLRTKDDNIRIAHRCLLDAAKEYYAEQTAPVGKNN